jgi:hypothetical protein
MRTLTVRVLSAVAVVPGIFYLVYVAEDVLEKMWKIGWISRPFTFIGVSGILIFSLYEAGVAIGLSLLWRKTHDQLIGSLAVTTLLMLFLYWFGFLSIALAVLRKT